MVEFFSEIEFELKDADKISLWIEGTAGSYGCEIDDLSYVFCGDERLHEINMEFLAHDTYTDIITFNYNLHKQVNGEVYISVDRVRENAQIYEQRFEEELHRVIIHGLLHLCGLEDKSHEQEQLMRRAEDTALEARNFA
jgi:rRNA maturation RNase YbeY